MHKSGKSGKKHLWSGKKDLISFLISSIHSSTTEKNIYLLFGPIIKQLAKFMGVPDNEAEINTIGENLKEIMKEIPLIGDLVKALEGDINNKLGEIGGRFSVSGGEFWKFWNY